MDCWCSRRNFRFVAHCRDSAEDMGILEKNLEGRKNKKVTDDRKNTHRVCKHAGKQLSYREP